MSEVQIEYKKSSQHVYRLYLSIGWDIEQILKVVDGISENLVDQTFSHFRFDHSLFFFHSLVYIFGIAYDTVT